MAIPLLIGVLWLMFDEEGDGLTGCFQHVFTPVSWKIPSAQKIISRVVCYTITTLAMEAVLHASSLGNCFCRKGNNSDSKTAEGKSDGLSVYSSIWDFTKTVV